MKTLELDLDTRGVATVTLARPQVHNAIDAAMIAELTEIAGEIAASDAVRVVVLTGDGPTFCAGADLAWMKAMIRAAPEVRADNARALAMMLKAWREMPKPVIGKVRGNAYGGGVGLMSVCDVVLGTKSAEYGLTEPRLGLIPATIAPYVIARLGAARSRSVMLAGRRFWSQEAMAIGLVDEAVRAVDLDAALDRQIAPFLDCAPGAVADTKSLIASLSPPVTEAQIEASIDALVARWQTDEAREGINAFFGKRPPRWSPRA